MQMFWKKNCNCYATKNETAHPPARRMGFVGIVHDGWLFLCFYCFFFSQQGRIIDILESVTMRRHLYYREKNSCLFFHKPKISLSLSGADADMWIPPTHVEFCQMRVKLKSNFVWSFMNCLILVAPSIINHHSPSITF